MTYMYTKLNPMFRLTESHGLHYVLGNTLKCMNGLKHRILEIQLPTHIKTILDQEQEW